MIPTSPRIATSDNDLFLSETATTCVKCGLCLPHCPTYALSHNEAESPRGRIGLIQALRQTDDIPGDTLATHLERCLSCRRCEAVCPARVPYGQLIDAARAELLQRGRRLHRSERALMSFAARPRLRRFASALFRAALWLRLPALIKPFAPARLRRLIELAPAKSKPVRLPMLTEAAGPRRGRVALFVGCMGQLLEAQVLADSIRLLSAAGYEVVVPEGQGCCGAVALHAGEPRQARELMLRNRDAFDAHEVDAIAFTASGCGATLKEYDRLIGADAFAASVHDVAFLLAQTGWRPAGPTMARLALHEPCTQANVVGEHAATQRLLEALPDSRVVALDGNPVCCGAAGAHLLTCPDSADELLDAKIAAIRASGAATVVCSNVGCAVHLRAGLRRAGLAVDVDHPASVLAAGLRTPD